jgi:tetratricopeptide (TPR) repeat protein
VLSQLTGSAGYKAEPNEVQCWQRFRVAGIKLPCYYPPRVARFGPPILKAMDLLLKAFPGIAALLLTAAALHAEPADELIAKGDAYYINLQAAEALKYYLPAEKLEPNNVRLLVRISREYRHLMTDSTKPEEMLRLGGTAVGYARRAVVLDPENPEAQLAVAISYGKLQPLEGNREKIAALYVIKDAADKAIKLDPHSDIGWHVLGRWHEGLADVNGFQRAMALVAYGIQLPDSTYKEAARCFEKAIELNPNRLMHYIELGRVYAQMGRTTDARCFITKGLSMQNTEKDDPETKREGREILAKLH